MQCHIESAPADHPHLQLVLHGEHDDDDKDDDDDNYDDDGDYYDYDGWLQCHIESAPADSLIILTYNSSYMENMKTLVPTYRLSYIISYHISYHIISHTTCPTWRT